MNYPNQCQGFTPLISCTPIPKHWSSGGASERAAKPRSRESGRGSVSSSFAACRRFAARFRDSRLCTRVRDPKREPSRGLALRQQAR